MIKCCLALGCALLLLLSSCSQSRIRIGALLSLTGPTAAFGISAANAIKLAADEINEAGGIKDRKVEIEIADDQSNIQDVAGIVEHLIKEHKVEALLAEPVSTRAMIAAPIAQQNGTVMISSASVKPELTMHGDYIFRACFISSTEGEAIARFAREKLKANKAAIILDEKNDYAVVLAGFFADSFKKLGGQIVSQQKYETNALDLGAQMQAIKTAAPDIVFAPGFYTTAPLVAREVKRAGIQATLQGTDLRDALAQTKDFAGVTGKITLDANRNAHVPVYILRIEKGKIVLDMITGLS